MAVALRGVALPSAGRFVPGEPRDWGTDVRVNVGRHIRAYPTLAEWETLGAFLGAGGLASWRGVLGARWAASNDLRDAMAKARTWDAAGRPEIDKNGCFNTAPEDDTDPWAAGLARLAERQKEKELAANG